MNIEFKTTSDFLKDYKKLLKKYRSLHTEFESLKEEILLNPKLGIDLGGGFRKIRLKIESKGKSENKGARVITYEMNMIWPTQTADKENFNPNHGIPCNL